MRRGFLCGAAPHRRLGELSINSPGDATQRAPAAPAAADPKPAPTTSPTAAVDTHATQRDALVRLCNHLEALEHRCDNDHTVHLRPQLALARREGRFALADGSEDALRAALLRLYEVSSEASQPLWELDECVELHLALGPDWEQTVNAVRAAVKRGDLEALRLLFDGESAQQPQRRVVPVDSRTSGGIGSTWLSHAAAFATPPVLRFFLERGAALEARDIFEDTVLHSAAREGRADNVALLLAAGADVQASNITGSTPLHLAVIQGGLACIQVLVRAGARLDARCYSDGFPPIFFAVHTPNPPALRYLLGTGRVDFTWRSACPEMRTLVSLALRPCARDHANVVRQIIVEEAYRRELAQRGSGDPEGVLGLGLVVPRQRCGHRAFFCCARCDRTASYVPDSDPAQAPARSGAQLPQRGRVLRYTDGASVAHPSALAPSQFVAPPPRAHLPRIMALLMATHARCGADSPARMLPRDAAAIIASLLKRRARRSCASGCLHAVGGERCACVLAQQPCFQDCPDICHQHNEMNTLRWGSTVAALSDCAADHLEAVRALSDAQLRARYPLACIERWGSSRQHRSCDEDGAATVALGDVLSSSDAACAACGARGAQAFSFCMNRVVNSDRVKHCLCCGRCFYHRPGRLPTTCPYCTCNPRGRDAPLTPLRVEDQTAEDTSEAEQRLAAVGYWGR